MKKIKVISIFGTRPEAHKMAPVIRELEKDDRIESKVCVTAQHREMLDIGLNAFHIEPDIDLNIMKHNQSLTDIMLGALTGLGDVFEMEKPDLCLVHGDTLTTFAASLAAFYRGVKVGHVEAGLRTGNKYAPYPEEINRRLTGVLADIHFAPTQLARKNLLNETVAADTIFVTGNTALDVMGFTVKDGYTFREPLLNGVDYTQKVIMMTAHRSENIGKGIENICRAALKILDGFPDTFIVYPVHLNPKVRNTVFPMLGGHERALLTDPVDILDMHNLIKRSYLVMSDSGGIQEEAPFLHKPVLVMREVTERPEGLATGALRLTGVNEDVIYDNARELILNGEAYERMANAKNPFGDGRASERIVKAILYYFGAVNEKPDEFDNNQKYV